MGQDELFTHRASSNPTEAHVSIDTGARGDPVDPYLYGKFCEHLVWNIYGGMEAQILHNPTFGEWPFRAEHMDVSGGRRGSTDPDEIEARIEAHAEREEFPSAEALKDAYEDALAFWWVREGDEESVRFSPDTAPNNDRSQRFEAVDPDGEAGITQWTYLPLHRTNGYEYRTRIRAKAPVEATLSIAPLGDDGETGEPLVSETIPVETDWETIEGTIEVPDDADVQDDGLFAVSLTTSESANVVVDRVLLYPDDHVDHADPEVVEFLREADLPLLRWPGGNFVSGYQWEDGVGPVDDRPTKPNPAWGGLEYNLFGTDEFIDFCDAVGCEPFICINAGDGTPEEAAKWVEYCNGSTDTEMGALRAEHGHPEPYDVEYWEIGNEVYGQWQVHWTTPDGYVDRYRRFVDAMKEVDPSIKVQACGNRSRLNPEWNDHVIPELGESLRSITDHILTGGSVDAGTGRDELFHAFMGFSEQLGREYRELRESMREAGVEDPRLAITELQLFASFDEDSDAEGGDGALSKETMPTSDSISEALYTSTIIHECIRMGEFVEMLTHSATVNHGGGLRKKKERTWANPIHYAHSMGIALSGGTPIGVSVESDTIATENEFLEIEAFDDVPALDAVAVLDEDESELTVMLVTRVSQEDPIETTIDTGGFTAASEADVVTLTAENLYDGNTLEEPERVVPESSQTPVEDGHVDLSLSPYSLTRLTIPARDA